MDERIDYISMTGRNRGTPDEATIARLYDDMRALMKDRNIELIVAGHASRFAERLADIDRTREAAFVHISAGVDFAALERRVIEHIDVIKKREPITYDAPPMVLTGTNDIGAPTGNRKERRAAEKANKRKGRK